MNEMYGNIELVFKGKNIDYVLSVGIDLKKEGFPKYMPSLGFYEDHELIDKKSLGWWDNEVYLLETLYKGVLVPWKENRIDNKEAFTELLTEIKGSSVEDFDGLRRLFEIAISMNFFENV